MKKLVIIGLFLSGLLLAAEIIFNLWSVEVMIFSGCFTLALWFISIFSLLNRVQVATMIGFMVFLFLAIFHFMAIAVI